MKGAPVPIRRILFRSEQESNKALNHLRLL
jgi:hypothetical protein